MSPVQPGSLMQVITSDEMPPALAPYPVLTESDVAEPPLQEVAPATPASSTNAGTTAPAPTSPNGQPRIATCIVLSNLAVLLVAVLLLWKGYKITCSHFRSPVCPSSTAWIFCCLVTELIQIFPLNRNDHLLVINIYCRYVHSSSCILSTYFLRDVSTNGFFVVSIVFCFIIVRFVHDCSLGMYDACMILKLKPRQDLPTDWTCAVV